MIGSIFGIKKNMTSTYDARGRRVAATVVEVKPNLVTQIKRADGKDGYSAVQLGVGEKKNIKKPQQGLLKKAGTEAKIRWFREVKTEEEGLKIGQEIKAQEVIAKGDAVKVTGVSKGKGFQGGVRRHGFHGGPKTHGQSDRHRAPGSVGQGTTPGRVYKGKRMAGHMGTETVSTRNLEVISVDRNNNLVTIKGAVPGHTGSLIEITKLGRIKGYTPPPEEKEDEEEEDQMKSDKSEGQLISESEKTDTLSSETPISSDLSENTKEGEENA